MTARDRGGTRIQSAFAALGCRRAFLFGLAGSAMISIAWAISAWVWL